MEAAMSRAQSPLSLNLSFNSFSLSLSSLYSVSEKFPDPSNSEMASSWILSVKVASISACVLSTALLLKLSFPVLLEFISLELPYLWSIGVTLLKPPYLYLLLNCIILTIVASSKLQPQKLETDEFAVAPHSLPRNPPEESSFADQSPINNPFVQSYVDEVVEEISEARPDEETPDSANVTENEEFALPRSNLLPPRKRNPAETDKPLFSQRIGYRRSVKASPEGGKALLGVSKPKRQETLESTWRMITEGRPMPLTRHLKKSDTWDTQGRGARHDDPSSETFNDAAASNSSSPIPSPSVGSARLRRDPSPSQDELNRRVEAFIKKFNEEMRMQRQQSLQQYVEVVGPTSGTR